MHGADVCLVCRSERNIIEAASNGASQSIKLVANITVNLIAFVALLDFVNATLVWLGDRVGMDDPKLTFQVNRPPVTFWQFVTTLFVDLSVLFSAVDAEVHWCEYDVI